MRSACLSAASAAPQPGCARRPRRHRLATPARRARRAWPFAAPGRPRGEVARKPGGGLRAEPAGPPGQHDRADEQRGLHRAQPHQGGRAARRRADRAVTQPAGQRRLEPGGELAIPRVSMSPAPGVGRSTARCSAGPPQALMWRTAARSSPAFPPHTPAGQLGRSADAPAELGVHVAGHLRSYAVGADLAAPAHGGVREQRPVAQHALAAGVLDLPANGIKTARDRKANGADSTERRAEQAMANVTRQRDLDETRRLAYMALLCMPRCRRLGRRQASRLLIRPGWAGRRGGRALSAPGGDVSGE